jgi:hypothetical protein
MGLLYFFVNGVFAQDGVVLFKFQSLVGVSLVFGGYIPAGAGHATVFVHGAL